MLYIRTCPDAKVLQSKVACEIKAEERICSRNAATHGQTYLSVFHGLDQSNFQACLQEPSLNYHVRIAPCVAMLPCSS